MLVLLSPAKNMADATGEGLPLTGPVFLPETGPILRALRAYSPWQLESLMKVNPEIALKTFDFYQKFDPALPGSPAALCYHGLAYQNLDAASFTGEDFAFAQQSLRFLSAFYGVLRPLDGMLPYRLDFLCPVKVEGKRLYSYWGDRIYQEIFSSGEPVADLCSGEYSRAFDPYRTGREPFVRCRFLQWRKGKWVTLPTEAKMARGQMARAVVKHRWTRPEQLRDFSWAGYEFIPQLSTGEEYVFRKELLD